MKLILSGAIIALFCSFTPIENAPQPTETCVSCHQEFGNWMFALGMASIDSSGYWQAVADNAAAAYVLCLNGEAAVFNGPN